jgi:hypothetical protein
LAEHANFRLRCTTTPTHGYRPVLHNFALLLFAFLLVLPAASTTVDCLAYAGA